MLKPTLAVTALLAVGLSACLEDSTGPECQTFNNPVVETRGDTVVTQIGLRYIEIAAGASQLEASWCSAAVVNYRGTLLDGTQFDEGTFPFTPGITNAIAGFHYGIVGMTVGEQRRLIIPSDLGFGPQARLDQNGNVVIPANSTVVFDVELVSTE